jgi:hypothetical protein
MTRTTTTASARLRRIVPAALVAAAVTLGGSTLADPAIASAALDRAAYDRCILRTLVNEPDTPTATIVKRCCEQSGGHWFEVSETCASNPLEHPVGPPAQATAPLVPGPVTAPITQTLAPGPGKQD